MRDTSDLQLQRFDENTSSVLRAQYAIAERSVNGVRIAVFGVLGIAGALYAPFLSRSLNYANVIVLAPVLVWAIIQHVAIHARGKTMPSLGAINAVVDATAISGVLLSLAVFGDVGLAVKAPIVTAYLLMLGARSFSGRPALALATSGLAVVQYLGIGAYLIGSGRLRISTDPTSVAAITGTSVPDELTKVLLVLLGGAVTAYGISWNKRTLRQAVTSRRDFEARFRAVFEHSGVGVALLNERGEVLESNDSMTSLLHVPAMEQIGRRMGSFTHKEDCDVVDAVARELMSGERDTATLEVRLIRRDGSSPWGSLTLSRAEGVREVRLIAVLQDITERKSLEAKLLHQAFYDGLTGLANRALFRDRVEQALARTQRERSEVAVLFLDLDNFKQINDTLGHAAGDALLRAVANRLLSATRGCDTVARLGGDEFAVVLEKVRREEDATVVAERIMSALRGAIELDGGNTAIVSGSIGIARADSVDTVDELLRNADVAMYAAKSGRRGRHVFFDPAMHTALLDRAMLETDLRRALADGELWVAYQPIVDLETSDVKGIEALARWTHPLKGSIDPGQFIPVAEETGLITQIGHLVLHEACRQTATWNARRDKRHPLSVTVNLSAKQVESPELSHDVQRALLSTGLPPTCLILEITESVIMKNAEATQQRLQELKKIGVRLAIDDFGTGYSSLAYLQQFPVDILKIDRSFTKRILDGPNEDALARTIIALGGLLTLNTIAEGVEETTQHDRLRDLGCELGQGYLFGQPLKASELDSLMAKVPRPTSEREPAETAR